jgi:hypothetical protein
MNLHSVEEKGPLFATYFASRKLPAENSPKMGTFIFEDHFLTALTNFTSSLKFTEIPQSKNIVLKHG